MTYWDTEAYCIPFYLGTKDSTVAKNLLNQRYDQLKNAIKNAEKIGLNQWCCSYTLWLQLTERNVTTNGKLHLKKFIGTQLSHKPLKNIRNYNWRIINFLENKGIKILIAISRFWQQRVNLLYN